MSDHLENENHEEEEIEPGEESFAELFESYQGGMNENLNVGDKITGKIIAIDSSHVFVDTGTKIDGVVNREELVDETGELPISPGDELELYVIGLDESEVKLSKAVSGIGGLNTLREAYKSRIPVEGKVQAVNKGGFQVEVLHRKAFCPMSQMDVRYVEHPEEYVGNTYRFLIKRFEENGRNIVLSRRENLEKEHKKAHEEFFKDLSPDAVIEGRVTRLMPYGAFVELTPGVEGMVHISELSWSRLQKPDEAVKTGDTIRVKVLRIEEGKKKNEKKIALSVKQISGDPWDTVADTIHSGDRLKGKVTRCMGFGVFVEIAPGIEGLVHISEMSYVKRVLNPEDEVIPGDEIWVVVKDVDAAGKRVSLSIRDAEGDPWADIHNKYTIGQSVEGVFEQKAKFGYFVALEPGITGLIPKSKVGQAAAASVDTLKQGDPVTVIIEEIHPETRRISLGITDATEEGNWQGFADDTGKMLGSLGEQLKRALHDQDGE